MAVANLFSTNQPLFLWMRCFSGCPSFCKLSECFAYERWTLPPAELCELLAAESKLELGDHFKALVNESMHVLEANFAAVEESVVATGLARSWESNAALTERRSAGEVPPAQLFFLQRLFFYSVAMYKRGDTGLARAIQEQLSATGIPEFAAAVQIEQAGYFLNRGYYPSSINIFKQLRALQRVLPIWDLHRLFSTCAIAYQAQGLYLESKHLLAKLSQINAKHGIKAFAPSLKRLSLSLAIESEEYAVAEKEMDTGAIMHQKSVIGEALWILERVRLSTAQGRISSAESEMNRLDILMSQNHVSKNVLAAVEERVLIELHRGRFEKLAVYISENLIVARERSDVSLILVLLLWQARVLMHFGNYEQGMQKVTEALEMARSRDLGKAKVRCLFMLVSLMISHGEFELIQAVFDGLQNAARAIHLAVHRFVCEALGNFTLLRKANASMVSASLATLRTENLLHCVRPLCVEYGLSCKIVVEVVGTYGVRLLALEDLVDELSISEALICVENESAVVFPVRTQPVGRALRGAGRSSRRALPLGSQVESQSDLQKESVETFARAEKIWKVVSYAGQTLIDVLQREIFSGRLSQFTAEDIHRISYPNVRFNRETHGSRVRVFLARLKKHFASQSVPVEIVWEALNKRYEVSFKAELIKLRASSQKVPG